VRPQLGDQGIDRRVRCVLRPAAATVRTRRPSPKGSPFERFFREFGWPNEPNGRTLRPFTLAQGSGFFISAADGYAVTNNHVVNNAV
jgi:serine protease Do